MDSLHGLIRIGNSLSAIVMVVTIFQVTLTRIRVLLAYWAYVENVSPTGYLRLGVFLD